MRVFFYTRKENVNYFSFILAFPKKLNRQKQNHPPMISCDSLKNISRHSSLEFIKESVNFNKVDHYVGFYELFILWKASLRTRYQRLKMLSTVYVLKVTRTFSSLQKVLFNVCHPLKGQWRDIVFFFIQTYLGWGPRILIFIFAALSLVIE
jgi:hypothetical protein